MKVPIIKLRVLGILFSTTAACVVWPMIAAAGQLPSVSYAEPVNEVEIAPCYGVNEREITLRALVRPEGSATSAYFDYGTGEGYGSASPAEQIGSGSEAVPVTARIRVGGELSPEHYRIVAESSEGKTIGADQAVIWGAPSCPSEGTLPPAESQGEGQGTAPAAPDTHSTQVVRCRVPSLKSQTISQGARRARRAGCKLGTVFERRRAGISAAMAHRIVSQVPRVGRVLHAGTRIDVTIDVRR